MAQKKNALVEEPVEETIFSFSERVPAPQDRCHQAPRLTTLRVGTMMVDGRRELCLIRNVSAGGLKAHIYSPVHEGQRVSFELKANQQTSGTISWLKESVIGVEFDQQIDVEGLLASQAGLDGWQPRMPRVEVDRLGELRIGARIYPINSCDMSQGGARIEIDHPLNVGDAVVMSLEKFRPIAGTVRWYKDGQGGIAFNQVVPFQELMTWLRSA